MQSLMAKAARALTGRDVLVRMRRPAIRNFNGQAYRLGDQAVIDVDPHLSPGGVLYCLAHECGHIRAHFSTLAAADLDLPPESRSLTPAGEAEYKTHPVNVKRERQAEAWAQRWLTYAEAHWKEYDSYAPDFERKLLALAAWLPAGQLERSRVIGAAAGAAAVKSYLRR